MPVLSEQMTDVQPRVSTEGRERTMAFFLAMRRVPRAKQVVMTAGRPARRRKPSNTLCWICSNYKVCIEKGSLDSCLHFPLDFTLLYPDLYHDSCILTFGNGGYGKSHSDLEVVDSTTDPGAAVDGVVEVANVDEPDSHTDEGDDFGELLAKLIQLLLQGGLLLFSGSHLITDLTDLS